MSNFVVSSYKDTYTIYELTEQSTQSRILVCPERGGIVIGCQLHGQELFYLDKASLEHPTANIRGGNPILFPICGQLEQDSYTWQDQSYEMEKHGFARTAVWEVVGTSNEHEASITLSLRSSEQTLQSYPFDFELLYTYSLIDGKLHTRQQYRNLTEAIEMPFYAGFHPYFAIDEDENKILAYDTDATEFIDYNDNIIKPFDGKVRLKTLFGSVCLLNAKKREIAFPAAGGTHVRLSYDDSFKYVVLWSAKNQPFICVEPWMATPGELNRQEELVLLAPGESHNAVFTIAIER